MYLSVKNNNNYKLSNFCRKDSYHRYLPEKTIFKVNVQVVIKAEITAFYFRF